MEPIISVVLSPAPYARAVGEDVSIDGRGRYGCIATDCPGGESGFTAIGWGESPAQARCAAVLELLRQLTEYWRESAEKFGQEVPHA